MKSYKILLCTLLLLLALPAAAQDDWQPTGVWPFENQRFMPAEVVTGLVYKKKTLVPCNIHIGNQTLWYVKDDTLMEALPGTVNRVTFKNGDTYIPVSSNTFGKIVVEDSVGKVVRVRLIDKQRFEEEGRSASNLGSFTLGGDFGEIGLDLIGSYIAKPEEEPLPTLDHFFFVYKLEIFPVTDKEVLKRINPARRKEYKAFTRSAEILVHNERSVRKIWQEFFVKY